MEDSQEQPKFDRKAHMARIRELAILKKEKQRLITTASKAEKEKEFAEKFEKAKKVLKPKVKKVKEPEPEPESESSDSESEPEVIQEVKPKTKAVKKVYHIQSKKDSAKEEYYRLKLERLKKHQDADMKQNALTVAKHSIDNSMKEALLRQLMPVGW